MAGPELHLAEPADLDRIVSGLKALAHDLNDPFPLSTEAVAATLFGRQAYAFALLAEDQGLLLAQPCLSTSAGGTLTHVSDLWVAAPARGLGLGRRLLTRAAREGRDRWQSVGLRVGVYLDNHPALAFYRRLGFVCSERDRLAILSNTALDP